jgi:hypothetical protein
VPAAAAIWRLTAAAAAAAVLSMPFGFLGWSLIACACHDIMQRSSAPHNQSINLTSVAIEKHTQVAARRRYGF